MVLETSLRSAILDWRDLCKGAIIIGFNGKVRVMNPVMALNCRQSLFSQSSMYGRKRESDKVFKVAVGRCGLTSVQKVPI